jgi:hypothetical protein
MILRYALSLTLLFFALGLSAQNNANTENKPQAAVKKDKKEPVKWGLRSVGISHDLSPYVMAFFENIRRFEFGAEANISNVFFLSAESGYSRIRSSLRTRTPFIYTNTGLYHRFGLDYNILHRSLDMQAVFVGARYGFANYGHELLVTSDEKLGVSPDGSAAYWEGTNIIKEKGMSRKWFELTGGLTTNVWRNFHASIILRWQFDLGGKDGEIVRSADVPGLRRADKSPMLVMNYKVIYRFPLQKSN